MTNFKGFASLVLAAAAVITTVSAETRCPGNVASVPLKIVNRHQIILGVSINHSGPYSFLLDTGTQITMVDPSLAAELHLSTQGAANVISSAGSYTSASYVQVELLEAGSHAVANQTALVYDLKNLNSANRPIRGVLGEDFLGRFDMLIDNAHSLLCLDDSATMRANVRGPRIALDTSAQSADSQPLPGQFIVAVRISHGARPVRLKLDSGSNVSLLYNVSQFMTPVLPQAALLLETGVDGAQNAFSALPPQDVKIGALYLSGVLFFIPRGTGAHANMAEDGVLPTGLFRRVFIDHVNHFAVLDPW
jgi:predicted aspartyl protease